MSEVYSTPKSDPINITALELTFSSLGFWRKLYLIINWLANILIGFFFTVALLASEENDAASMLPLTLVGLLVAYSFWTHSAIVNRRVTQLRVLCLVQVIPFMNPISALIFWAISSTSKTEQQASQPTTS